MIVFHHIPKTAGSSLNETIWEENKNTSLVIGSEGIISHKEKLNNTYKYIGGHFSYQEFIQTTNYSNCNHISILRHPLARIISYFEMAYRDDEIVREEICRNDKWGKGFDIFYRRFIQQANLLNIQCLYFSKHGKFYDAAKVIREKFCLVGTVRKFDALKSILLDFYLENEGINIPASFPKRNISSKNENYLELISAKTLLAIENENLEDYDLYNWINEKYDGLYRSTTHGIF